MQGKNEIAVEAVRKEAALVLCKYRIGGRIRFLSHSEILNVFRRALVRGEINLAYSHGFNPHARLSVVLPKSVGIEGEEEILAIWVRVPVAEDLKERLSRELPAGIEITEVKISEAKMPQPVEATYVFSVRQEEIGEQLRVRIENLLKSENLRIDRQIDEKGNTKSVDIRPFIKSIRLGGTNITIECIISPSGSVRIDEILGLLEIDAGKIEGTIRRTKIEWNEN